MQRMYNVAYLALCWLVVMSTGHPTEKNQNLSSVYTTKSEIFEMVNLGCHDTLNVTVDENCQFELTARKVLAGSIPDCLEESDFLILVEDHQPANQPIVDGCGSFRYYIGLEDPADCTDFQSCWGYVKAEDKTAPEIILPKDTTFFLSCERIPEFLNDPNSLKWADTAYAQDNCGPLNVPLFNFYDELAEAEQCDTLVIKRTFYAEDEKGNTSNDFQLIKFARPGLDSVKIKEEVEYHKNCISDNTLLNDEDGNIHPSETGYPFFVDQFGDTTFLDAGHCGLAAAYKDIRFDVCPEKYKLERTWTITDWCTNTTKTLVQVIRVGDLKSPIVKFPKDSFSFSAVGGECKGAIKAIFPTVEEPCSNFSIQAELYQIRRRFNIYDTVFLQALPLIGEDSYFDIVPLGDYLIYYQIQDDCKNIVKDTIKATIIDDVKPIAKCTDAIHVTLDNSGFGLVTAQDVDEGSSDNCMLDSIQVSRWLPYGDSCEPIEDPGYSNWDKEVYFTCCDLGEAVEVRLKAIDIYGNSSICWMNVYPEDKEAPTCIAPPNVVIDCDSFPKSFDYNDTLDLQYAFGMAQGIDGCHDVKVTELTPLNLLESCGSGKIIRYFHVEDAVGNAATQECEQHIQVLPVHNYEIRFPKDYFTVCAEPEPDSIHVNELGCDLLAVYQDDEKLSTATDECFKIFRTYQVINWCEYDGESEPIVLGRDYDCNGIPGDQDLWVLVRPDGKVYLDSNNVEIDSIPARDSITWNCFGMEANPWGHWVNSDTLPSLTSRGFWEYTQIIKVTDSIPPVIFVEDTVRICIDDLINCSAEAVVSFAILDECVEGDIEIRTYLDSITEEAFEFDEDPWSIVGRYPKYLMTGVIPEGDYRVEIISDDQCGNRGVGGYVLQIIDCTPPEIICHDGLVVELMPQEPETDADGDGDFDLGANIVWVDDLVISYPQDDCTGPIQYSINKVGELPDINQKSLTLTCDDQSVVDVEVYVWDSEDNPLLIQADSTIGGPNSNYCTTFIRVQDNQNNFCNPNNGLQIAGTIASPFGETIGNVDIIISGQGSGETQTGEDGTFLFQGLEEGNDYTVSAKKEDEHLKGVSTLDIIYITKHILGISVFESPYQLLAADLNRSKSISTYDIILLRKAILNIDETAIQLAGWIFIDADHHFPNPAAPWSGYLPSIININNIDDSYMDLNFIGIKMGDVSGIINPRSKDTKFLSMQDRLVQKGEEIVLSVWAYKSDDLEGLQFALQVNPKLGIIENIIEGRVQSENLDIQNNGSILKLSWDRFNSNKEASEPSLFKIKLKALKATYLSEMITLADRKYSISPEWYATSGMVYDLNLNWTSNTRTDQVQIKVWPNPIDRQFFIDITNPKLSNGKLLYQLRNVNGQLIMTGEHDLEASHERVEVSVNQNLSPGVYWLRTECNEIITTTKLVKY